MPTSYTYVLGVDFTAVNIDLSAFQTTIAGSSITSATVQYLIRSGTSVVIWFSGPLSTTDQTTLAGLVTAYVYVAPTILIYVDTTTVQTIANKLINTSNVISDVAVASKVLGFSLSGMAASTQLTLAGTLTASRTYTFPEAGVASNIILSNSTGTQTISTGNVTIAGASAVLALSGASSTITLANTTQSTSSSTGALQVAGGTFTKNIWLGGTAFATQAVSIAGPLLNIAASTVTASNTTDMAFVSVQQPTLANSVAASTTTNASTLYIADAPVAGTNETITNAYAVNVAAGKVRVGGTLQIPTGALAGYILASDASGNAAWEAPSVLAFNGFSDGTVSAPGAYWLSDTSTGFYRIGASNIAMTLGGSQYINFTTTATNFLNTLSPTKAGNSTATLAPLYSNPVSTVLAGSANYFFNYFNTPTTTGSTTGIASTVLIAGAPANATIAYALNVAAGNTLFAANVNLNGTSAVLALSGASSTVTLANTTAATSSSTGALQVAGGLYAGANSLFAANVNLSGTSAVLVLSGASSTVTLANTTAATSSSTGALQVAGGLYAGANSLFAANVNLSGASAVLALSGASSTVTLANTTQSTSSSTGALQVAGGLYAGANSLFAANVNLNGTSAVLALSGASSTGTLANTTQSTSSSTGALQVAGGTFTKNIWLGGTAFATQAVSIAGPLLNIAASTVTASNTTDMAFVSVQQPTLANSVAASTTTNASTLYIANAPVAGTNETITNAYAVNVAAGKVRVGGTLQIPTGATNGYLLASDASGNATWTNPAVNSSISYFSAISNSIFSTTSISQTNITTMTLTPTASGTYLVYFTCSYSNSAPNSTATFDLALNNTSISNTSNANTQSMHVNQYSTTIGAVQAFNGSTDVITARVSISGSSVTVLYRFLYAVRLST